MIDESSKVADQPTAEAESQSPVEHTAAQSPPDAPQHQEVQPQAAEVEQPGPEQASGEQSSEAPSADAEKLNAVEQETVGEDNVDEDDVEIVERPTSFAPMSVEVESEEKQEKKPSDEAIEMDWYILKVQSNRERSIADALRRKVAIEGLDRYFDDVLVPTEKVTEFKAGKKKVVERKLYPGYIVVHMHINDDTWFAVRETSGIGDFTGAGGKPTPMLPHEVSRILQTEEEETDEAPKLNIAFKIGDRVKVKEGNFESFEGEVSAIDEQSGRITVMINIFGRSTPVELEYWQVEQM